MALPSSPLPGAVAAPSGEARPHEPWQPAEAPPGGRVVLFSQIRECASIIESFVRHYAALGVYRLLLYLDDPGDVAREVLEESGWLDAGFVELIPVDNELRATWPSMPSWSRVGSYCDMEVQSRQILNNEHALRRARQLGADWLLHVDCDELLCLPELAPSFFSGLSSRGCTMYTFCNVEGVPQAADSTDVLASVRVFRQNMGFVPRNPRAGAAFFSWQLRLGGWFISYENGKSAVSVKHAVRCLSVCMWEVTPQLEVGKARAPDGSTCTWYTNNKLLWDAAVVRRREGGLSEGEEVPRLDDCPRAVLLHFCVCDFASFWRKRWTQLGYLSASDQFRVRASAGAMMSRFYRLQREGRQGDARELYELMCICKGEEMLAEHLAAGVLLRAEPERPAGPAGPGWPPSRRPVRYAVLAEAAEARGAPLDAWQLWGKALEALLTAGDAPLGSAVAAAQRRRASCAEAAGLLASAVADLDEACKLGDEEALTARARVLEALRGAGAALPVSPGSAAAAPPRWDAKLPTPAELTQHVARAVRPDPKDSRLYCAVLPVAMAWWQEVGGDERQFVNALGRAAIAARAELAALDECIRARPMRGVRELWDLREAHLKEDGACQLDLPPAPGLWPSVAQACAAALGDKESVVLTGCHCEGHALGGPWVFFAALTAEVARAFGIVELRVLTELRLSQPRPGESSRGPEVDNGGLLPDNRREVSFRVFVPVDGREPGPPAMLMLRTRDGERALSMELRAGRAFLWWSRQTFHQVLGGEGYFSIAGWAVVPQKADRLRIASHAPIR